MPASGASLPPKTPRAIAMRSAFRCRRASPSHCWNPSRIRCWNWSGATRAPTGRSPRAPGRGALRARCRWSWKTCCVSLRTKAACSKADSSPAASIASGAMRRFCARSGASRWRSFAAKWSRSSSTRWRASSPTGRACSRRAGQAPVRPRIWMRLLDVIENLQGAPIPASLLETSILPARIADYDPAGLDTLIAAGEVTWAGVEPMGERDGRIALFLADKLPLLLQQRPLPIRTAADRARRETARPPRINRSQLLRSPAPGAGGGYPAKRSKRCGGWCGAAWSPTIRCTRCAPTSSARTRAAHAGRIKPARCSARGEPLRPTRRVAGRCCQCAHTEGKPAQPTSWVPHPFSRSSDERVGNIEPMLSLCEPPPPPRPATLLPYNCSVAMAS